MGGAPPPPLGVAPQDPKKPEKFGRFRPDLGGLRGPRISVQDRGCRGAPDPLPPELGPDGGRRPGPRKIPVRRAGGGPRCGRPDGGLSRSVWTTLPQTVRPQADDPTTPAHQLGPRSGSPSLGSATSGTSQLCRRRSFRSAYRPRSGSSDKASVVVCGSQTRPTRCDSRQSLIVQLRSSLGGSQVVALSLHSNLVQSSPALGLILDVGLTGVHSVHTYGSFGPCPLRFATRVLPPSHSPPHLAVQTPRGVGGGSSEKGALLRAKVAEPTPSAPLWPVLVRTRTNPFGVIA